MRPFNLTISFLSLGTAATDTSLESCRDCPLKSNEKNILECGSCQMRNGK